MKVLHVIPAIGSTYGGPTTAILNLVEALARQGIQTDLIATNVNGEQVLDLPVQTWIEQQGYRLQVFPCWQFQDYKVSPSMARWLFRHVADYNLVDTHAIFSLTNLSAYWACQQQQIPYIIHPHGMLDTWALSYKSWKKYPYYQYLERPALNRASAIRALAIPEVNTLKQLKLKPPIVSIPNGIWDKEFTNPPQPQQFFQAFPQTQDKTLILFLGRIDPKKGLDLLATAFAQVHQQFPDTHLVIAGPDNIGFLPTVQQYFADTCCLEAVTFTGMLTGSLKRSALAAATLYVAPSYSEGFSMSVLEGMASGLPCVITTACNFPEAAAANAAQVVEIDAQAIAQSLLDCLKHPQEAKEMGDRARQFIFQNYTWDRIAANLVQVYTDILKTRQKGL